MGGGELAFRVAGMLLQLLGVFTVFWGIQETRKLFGRPSLTFVLRRWLRSFPRLKPRAYEASITAVSPGQTVRVRGYTSTATDPSASLEQRVELLERNIEHLRSRINEVQGELEQEMHKVTSSVNEEKSTRITEDQRILSKLEVTETGGLHISAMGAVWLFIGVILSSIPNELSRLFN